MRFCSPHVKFYIKNQSILDRELIFRHQKAEMIPQPNDVSPDVFVYL